MSDGPHCAPRAAPRGPGTGFGTLAGGAVNPVLIVVLGLRTPSLEQESSQPCVSTVTLISSCVGSGERFPRLMQATPLLLKPHLEGEYRC